MLCDREREPQFDEQGYFIGFLKRGGRLRASGDHYLDRPYDPRLEEARGQGGDLGRCGFLVISNDEIVSKLRRRGRESFIVRSEGAALFAFPYQFQTSNHDNTINSDTATVSPEDSASMRGSQPEHQQRIAQQQQPPQQLQPGSWRGLSGRTYTVPTGELRGSHDTYHVPLHARESDSYRHRPDPSGAHGLAISSRYGDNNVRQQQCYGTGRRGYGGYAFDEGEHRHDEYDYDDDRSDSTY